MHRKKIDDYCLYYLNYLFRTKLILDATYRSKD